MVAVAGFTRVPIPRPERSSLGAVPTEPLSERIRGAGKFYGNELSSWSTYDQPSILLLSTVGNCTGGRNQPKEQHESLIFRKAD